MTQPTLNYLPCHDPDGGHRMAWWQWGDARAGHVVVCVHGLTRQGRDFDALARALLEKAGRPLRVVCPDVVGRGRSDWLKSAAGYQIPVYAGDMVALLQSLGALAPISRLDWIGTSMGGLIGMVLAGTPGLPLPRPVDRLVLNDVGPAIQWEALQRIGGYVGRTGSFATLQDAADAMWAISQGFGPHTARQWLDLSEHMVRTLPDGSLTLHYDPAIAVAFQGLTRESAGQGESALWQLFDAITARTLVLRGGASDLLTAETVRAMAQRGPKAEYREFAGVGHAPTLVHAEQQEPVLAFLLD